MEKTLVQPDINRSDLVTRAAKYLRNRPSANSETVITELEQRHTWRQIDSVFDRLDAVGWGKPHGKTARTWQQLATVMADELPAQSDHDYEPIKLKLPPDQMPNRRSRLYPRCSICFDSGRVWEDPQANDPNYVGYEFVSVKVPCPRCHPDPNRSPDVSNEEGAELAKAARAGLAAMFNDGGAL